MSASVRRKNLPPRKTVAKIAALSGVDHRTAEAYLLGTKRTLPPVAEAIRNVMCALGVEPPTVRP